MIPVENLKDCHSKNSIQLSDISFYTNFIKIVKNPMPKRNTEKWFSSEATRRRIGVKAWKKSPLEIFQQRRDFLEGTRDDHLSVNAN